jgi:NADH-quinone oxidoreductase subunit M
VLATPIGLTAALCVWLSVGLGLGGFGLTLRSIESRMGQLSLSEFHGLYEHAPMIAAFFLLTGLASIGFPGTVGFVATELLVDGAVIASPLIGAAVVLATALNSVAVLHAYFRIFNGTRHRSSIDLRSRPAERVAILTLTLLIFGGGLIPQPGVSSRYRAAVTLVEQRRSLSKSIAEEHVTPAETVDFSEKLSAPWLKHLTSLPPAALTQR